jgi:hypothetical protein
VFQPTGTSAGAGSSRMTPVGPSGTPYRRLPPAAGALDRLGPVPNATAHPRHPALVTLDLRRTTGRPCKQSC